MIKHISVRPFISLNILSFFFILFSIYRFFFTPHRFAPDSNVRIASHQQLILSSIEGEVARPGHYILTYGAKVEDLLALSKPLPDANLAPLKLKKVLKHRESLAVPPKGHIAIYLQENGSVPHIAYVKAKTPLRQLHLTEKRSRRYLKHGETVQLPESKKR